MNRKYKEIKPGQWYGILCVIKRADDYIVPSTGQHLKRWKCKCKCGKIIIVRATHLKIAHSCGCLTNQIISASATKHGLHKTPEYRAWCAMKNRCTNPNVKSYEIYGGRGIRICKYFMDFENFYKDLGSRPEGYSLDRKDSNGHYSCGHCKQCKKHNWPENCRWATELEQNRNKRTNKIYKYKGVPGTLRQLIEHFEFDIEIPTVRHRLKIGMSLKKALTTPVKIRTTYTIDGVTKSPTEWCHEYEANYGLVTNRLARGWDILRALTTPSDKRFKGKNK